MQASALSLLQSFAVWLMGHPELGVALVLAGPVLVAIGLEHVTRRRVAQRAETPVDSASDTTDAAGITPQPSVVEGENRGKLSRFFRSGLGFSGRL